MATQAEKLTWLDLFIDSDEEMGVLDTFYLEDYYGVDGHLTLFHQATQQEFDIVMAEVAGGGPYPHDHFEGTRDATVMPLGTYEIRGRARDVIGNYTVLTDFQNPIGSERILPLYFDLVESIGMPFIVILNVKKYINVKTGAERYIHVKTASEKYITMKMSAQGG